MAPGAKATKARTPSPFSAASSVWMPPNETPDMTMRPGSISGRAFSQASAASTSRAASSCSAMTSWPADDGAKTARSFDGCRSMMYGPAALDCPCPRRCGMKKANPFAV